MNRLMASIATQFVLVVAIACVLHEVDAGPTQVWSIILIHVAGVLVAYLQGDSV